MTADDKTKAPVSESPASETPEGGTGAETPEQAVERLGTELEAKAEEARHNFDLYVRERAELENFKKRMLREKAEAVRYAIEPLARDLIPIIDNLERAVDHAASGGNGQPLLEGVRLVLKSALDTLERHGITRIEAAGRSFDPARHEAIAQVPDAEREPNQVVQQFLPGYSLHDRLLRPAQVSVSTKAPVERLPDDD